jgi:hypothetical protein
VDEMNEKMEVCISSGFNSFWIVDPKRRTVSVTEGDVTRHYRESASIALQAPLEGTLSVAAIFSR